MRKRFCNDYAPHPAVKEVERVKADLEKRYGRVVASSEENERDHVCGCENTCPASNFCDKCCGVGIAVVQNAAICDVTGDIQEEYESVKSGW